MTPVYVNKFPKKPRSVSYPFLVSVADTQREPYLLRLSIVDWSLGAEGGVSWLGVVRKEQSTRFIVYRKEGLALPAVNCQSGFGRSARHGSKNQSLIDDDSI